MENEAEPNIKKDRRGSKKGQFGQPPHIPTPEGRLVVQTLSGYGLRLEHIAANLKISVETLHEHYRADIDHGRGLGVKGLADSMAARAHNPEHKDCQRAAEYMMGMHAYHAKQALEVSGEGGGPLEIILKKVVVDAKD